jgi:hypothetical protein
MDRVGSAKVPPRFRQVVGATYSTRWRFRQRFRHTIVWRNGATLAERVLRLRNAGRFRQGCANPSRGLFPRRQYWRRRRGPKQPHAVMGGALGARR